MSVARAQREINSPEFAEWIAFYGLEPFGDERADLRMGIQTSNLLRPSMKKGAKAIPPSAFMLTNMGKPKGITDPKVIEAIMMAYCRAYGEVRDGGSQKP